MSVSAYYSRQTGYSRSYYNSYYAGNSAKDMYDTDQLMTTFGLSAGLGRRITWPVISLPYIPRLPTAV